MRLCVAENRLTSLPPLQRMAKPSLLDVSLGFANYTRQNSNLGDTTSLQHEEYMMKFRISIIFHSSSISLKFHSDSDE